MTTSDHFMSSNLLLDVANSTLGFWRASAKTRNWLGGSFFGDDHDTVSRTPRTIASHPSARTHHTPLQKQTLLRRGLGFRGVGEPLPRTAGIFVFDV